MLRKHYQSLHKEAHDLLQAMPFKAERRNRTLEIHSQHTDRGEEKNTLYFVPSHKKIEDCCLLSIYRETLSLQTHDKCYGMEDHPHVYKFPFLMTEQQYMLITGLMATTSMDSTK